MRPALLATIAVMACDDNVSTPADASHDAGPDTRVDAARDATPPDDGPPADRPEPADMPPIPPDVWPPLADAAFCPTDLGAGADAAVEPPVPDVTVGDIRWSVPLDGIAPTSPAIGPDGTIYVLHDSSTSFDAVVQAVSPDGETLWETELSSAYEFYDGCISVGSDGTAYVTSRLGWLGVVSPAGEAVDVAALDTIVIWKYAYEVSCPAVGPDESVYLTTSNAGSERKLYRYRLGEGITWTIEAPDGGYYPVGPLVGSDGTVFISIGYFPDERFDIAAVVDGTIAWVVPIDGYYGSALLLREDDTLVVFAVDPDDLNAFALIEIDGDGCAMRWFDDVVWPGTVTLLDGYIAARGGLGSALPGGLLRTSRTGALVWELPYDNPDSSSLRSPPVIGADGTIYFGVYASGEFVLRAVSPDGVERWRTELAGAGGTMALAEDGTLYVVGYDDVGDSRLFAIQTDSPGLMDAPWPHPRHDNRGSSWAGAEP